MAKLRIGGIWVGVIELELENWTVAMLREEVAKRSNAEGPDSIQLICSGKVLKDDDGTEKLSQLGIKNNAKILASRVSVDEGKSLKNELMAEEERSRRLARVKVAATALSKRHVDGSLPIEDFNIELENQGGQKVQLGTETDQRAVMMGLMLHENAKNLIRRQLYQDALEVLTMGEEAFSLCDPKVLEFIDNVPILQIDMVWCYFLLQDISWLSVAGIRLEKAREGLERCHGKDFSRIRLLQAGCQPELALHLRLELLEGVVAYHTGQFDKSRKALTSAQAKFSQLQVPDEALSHVMSMGFKERDARRALRLNNQDIGSAVDFLFEEKAKRAKKREDDIRHRMEIMEQKQYGVTPLKKAVNLEKLTELVAIGFEKNLAAEALRRNENDFQKALDDLTNPETNSVMQLDIEARTRKRKQRSADARIEELVSMGFDRSRVVAAVLDGETMEQTMSRLLSESGLLPTVDANSYGNPASEPNNANPDSLSNNNTVEGTSTAGEEERDAEMEDELARDIENADALSDYDIEVTKEGEAIIKYLTLLASTEKNNY
ncbi:NEDD8 ultimate buster 1-like isoform X2 [Durio zibethinus]|uniref:NEDD8 ultimate buster 1-like isoform X2 n=1 Tax=Durio zibethinus TaxID=66656 RepID=A0A6P5ZAT0_DURZI|nr:NEDD8 ultimate buster 1-like isoform X2 [Durio zibethinus]